MAGRAKENLDGGSLKYLFVYLKVRIFKCSYRIYIYIYIHIHIHTLFLKKTTSHAPCFFQSLAMVPWPLVARYFSPEVKVLNSSFVGSTALFCVQNPPEPTREVKNKGGSMVMVGLWVKNYIWLCWNMLNTNELYIWVPDIWSRYPPAPNGMVPQAGYSPGYLPRWWSPPPR